jgi:hypothetical protein
MTAGSIVKDLIYDAYSRYSEIFFRANSIFLPDAGREEHDRSEEAALTGGRSALKHCEGVSLASAANEMSPGN